MDGGLTDELSRSVVMEETASIDSDVNGQQQQRLCTPKVMSAVITPRPQSRVPSRGEPKVVAMNARSSSPNIKSREGSPKRRPTTPLELTEEHPTTAPGSAAAKMNYAPVWKPGFQNRRFHCSYLKKSFPAGFLLKEARSQISGDHFDHVLHEASKAGTMRIEDSNFSFTSWAKGGSNSNGMGFDDEEDDQTGGKKNGDPFADCAGPTLEELQRARRALKQPPSFDYVVNDPACTVRRATINALDQHQQHIQHQQQLHKQAQARFHQAQTHKVTSSSASSIATSKLSPTKPRVYHAPALMPTLNPVLNNTSSFIMNNQAGNNSRRLFPKTEFSQQYEKWIQDRRSNTDEKIWKNKGNNTEFNYSVHSFNGSSTKLGESKKIGVQSTLPSVPRPWLPEIGVEIYTTNQLMRTKTSDEFDKQYVYKVISSESSLMDLRLNIAHDIVDGIKQAFPDLPSLLNLTSAEEYHKIVPIKLEKIEMSFQFYQPDVTAWRPLTSEAEWIECKNLMTYYGGNIQVMYCLSAQSEQLLVNQIQRNYELQQAALAKRKPPISIEDLTNALEAEARRKQKRSASVPKLLSSTGEQKVKTLRVPPATPNDNTELSRSGSRKVLSQAGHQSVFYPQTSTKLKLMQSQSQASMNRLEAFANNLEGRILKTKW